MPEYINEDRNGHIRTTIKIHVGERVKLCRCQKSLIYPFCDETHKHLDTDAGPVVIEVIPMEKKETD